MIFPDLPLARCRSCGQSITWTVNVDSGKRMPVDFAPVVGGNVVLTTGNDGPEARVLGAAECAARRESGEALYVSHFSTCPHANAWRRR